MTKQQFQVALVLLFVTFCLLKSVPFRLEEDGKGYDCLWYLCILLAQLTCAAFTDLESVLQKIPGIIVI